MKENMKKETVKTILFVLLLLVGGTIAVILTDNRFILIISGMIIGATYKILEKWIDEEDNKC